MTPVCELNRTLSGIKEKILQPGQAIAGEVEGKPTSLTIAGGGDTVSYYQAGERTKVLQDETVATVFDRRGFCQKGVVYLTWEETRALLISRISLDSHAFQATLASLWRKMETQAGKSEPGEWNIWKILVAMVTGGRS